MPMGLGVRVHIYIYIYIYIHLYIYIYILEIWSHNHDKHGLLGSNTMMAVYMHPLQWTLGSWSASCSIGR